MLTTDGEKSDNNRLKGFRGKNRKKFTELEIDDIIEHPYERFVDVTVLFSMAIYFARL